LDVASVKNVLSKSISVKDKCSLLMGQALEQGAPDNVSVIVLDV
jgi:hypothetical protein